MGYENCGARERYPYDQLLDGQPHVIRARSEGTVRALRYGARRRGLRLRQRKIGEEHYEITAVPAGASPRSPRLRGGRRA